MFGDIITDLGAMITGRSWTCLRAGNINPEGTEHVRADSRERHPNTRDRNKVNPIATIWAGALLLNQLGEKKQAPAYRKSYREKRFSRKNQYIRHGAARIPHLM